MQRTALIILLVRARVDGNGEGRCWLCSAPPLDAPAQGRDMGRWRAREVLGSGDTQSSAVHSFTASQERNIPSSWAEGLTEASGLGLPQVCVINCTIPA